MPDVKSCADEIIELTKKNERIFLDTLASLARAKEEIRRLKEQPKTRTERVRQMFVEVLPHQERNDRPTVPSDSAIRLQTRIDAEEFFEKLSALYSDSMGIAYAKEIVDLIAKRGEIRKDLHDRLPEFADALADNAVTNEGFAVLFGIDSEPVFQLVHSSNMAKKDGPIVAGKRTKPEGWIAPDVAGELRRQGWAPTEPANVDEPIPYKVAANMPIDSGHALKVTIDECPIHGVRRFGQETLAFTECDRCENAQYNGSEIDPIGESNVGNEIAALAELDKKSEPTGPQLPQLRAVPIDRTLWDSDAPVDLGTAQAKIENLPVIECRVRFFGKQKQRRCLVQMPTTNERFGQYEIFRRDEEICRLSIGGSYLGAVRVASVERGNGGDMQVEFVKVAYPVDA